MVSLDVRRWCFCPLFFCIVKLKSWQRGEECTGTEISVQTRLASGASASDHFRGAERRYAFMTHRGVGGLQRNPLTGMCTAAGLLDVRTCRCTSQGSHGHVQPRNTSWFSLIFLLLNRGGLLGASRRVRYDMLMMLGDRGPRPQPQAQAGAPGQAGTQRQVWTWRCVPPLLRGGAKRGNTAKKESGRQKKSK